MSQHSLLADDEFDERFLITGKTAIQFTLAGYAKEREPFSVHFNAGQEMFLSTLLAVQADKERVIFDCSGSPETNRRFLAAERSTFVGRPGGVHVQFSGGRAVEINYEGAAAFAVGLPKTLGRLQRREYFRVETPRVNPLILRARLPSGESLNLPVHDISVSGIGFDVPAPPEGLVPDQILDRCHMSLPGDARELFFAATVRRVVELQMRSGTPYWRVGIQFNSLSTGDETRVQRYIDRLERERKELI